MNNLLYISILLFSVSSLGKPNFASCLFTKDNKVTMCQEILGKDKLSQNLMKKLEKICKTPKSNPLEGSVGVWRPSKWCPSEYRIGFCSAPPISTIAYEPFPKKKKLELKKDLLIIKKACTERDGVFKNLTRLKLSN